MRHPVRIKVILLLITCLRVFTNSTGDWGSIPGRIIPKTQWYLMHPCLPLTIIRCGSRGKWSNQGKGVVLSSYTSVKLLLKGSLWVDLDNGHPTYLHIYYSAYFVVRKLDQLFPSYIYIFLFSKGQKGCLLLW